MELITQEQVGQEIITLDKKRIEELQNVFRKLASEGKRILALAYKDLPQKEKYTLQESESDLIFVGFVGMIDPPRAEVAGAIKTCQDAGIRVIMITGDSELTAGAIAGMIGLDAKTLDATQLSKMTDEELNEVLKTTNVFSRIAPQDKLRIVRLLRAQ